MIHHILRATIVGAILLAAAGVEAYADPVIDWNIRANEMVVDARIYEGIHFRSAVETGTAMRRQIGALAAQKHFAP